MAEEAPSTVQGEALVLGGSSVRPSPIKSQGRKQQQPHQPQQVLQQENQHQNSANQQARTVSLMQLLEGGPQPVTGHSPPNLQMSRSLPQLSPNSSGQKLRRDSSSSWLPPKSPPGQARPATSSKK